ncbi:hypothetical protein JOD18_002654 [Gracilibacillus alcaliphilus]|nr:hypothetical protein [Gracilibacillus alcaliphilus]
MRQGEKGYEVESGWYEVENEWCEVEKGMG